MRRWVARKPTERERGLLACGLVLVAVCAAFSPSLSNRFVWDDLVLIANNPLVAGLDWARLRDMFSRAHLTTYMPLGWLSFAVLGRLGGMDPRPFHAAALALHASAAVAFWAVCRRLFAGRPRGELAALAAAVLFAVHPLNAWTAAWAIEIPDAVSTLLYLCCLFIYLGGRSPRRRAACLALFAVSLLFRWKSMSLPLALLALDFWPLRRRDRDAALREKLPFFALALTAASATVLAKSQQGYAPDFSLAVPARGLWLFLQLLLWPFGVGPYHRLDGAAALGLPAGEITALAALVTAWLWLRRARLPALWTAWVCYSAAIAPTALSSQSGFVYVYPPYGYLGGLAFFALLGECARRLWDNAAGRAAFAALLASWLLAARRECRTTFRDPVSFWTAAQMREPDLAAARTELGGALLDAGRYEDSWFYISAALGRNPLDPYARDYLDRLQALRPSLTGDRTAFWVREGRDLLALGYAEEAARLGERALQSRPRSAEAHELTADSLDALGLRETARRHREAALRLGRRPR